MAETECHRTVAESAKNVFEDKKASLEKQRKDMYDVADSAKRIISERLEGLWTEFQYASERYQNTFYTYIDKNKNRRIPFGGWFDQVIDEINKKEAQDEKGFSERYGHLVEQENRIYAQKIHEADHIYESQLAEETVAYNNTLDTENAESEARMKQTFDLARDTVIGLQPELQREMYKMLQANIPEILDYEPADTMPPAIEVGYINIDLDGWEGELLGSQPVIKLIKETYAYALADDQGKCVLRLPLGRAFSSNRFNKLILHDDVSRDSALEYMRALEMRLFMSIPCGKLRTTMIDPIDSSSNFSMFAPLGDDDERIISTRIWCDKKSIKEQLGLLIGQIEHVHQDCLRNEFTDIVEYNKYVGKNAEPFQVLFVADFPQHFDQEAEEMLEKIVRSGPKCGIFTFIVSRSGGSYADDHRILQDMEIIEIKNDTMFYHYKGLTHRISPAVLPSKNEISKIIATLRNGIKTSDRIIINFDEIADTLIQHKEKWFLFSDTNGLDIPIGLEGASRTVQIHLGGEQVTQHHALVSGTIGSGKSTLLHTIIMSALLKYSPEDLQMYLLDFKRGVEFKIYADSKLPNFKVISLDTEPEFGLSVLRFLEEQQAERGRRFRDGNCDNIERYNDTVGLSSDKIPRLMVVIDEFHEMFADPDSEITKQCGQLLEQVIREGRAFGIHVILASQTLPDNLSNIYGQILNRIALQSTASSAQYILDADNPALHTLVDVDSGMGVFNDGGGNKNANHLFRVAYFKEGEQKKILHQIRTLQAGLSYNVGAEKPRLLLSSIQDDDENPLNSFVKYGILPGQMELGCPLYLGEEIAMVDNFLIKLTARESQNLLILGKDNIRASLLYGFSVISILFYAFRMEAAGISMGDGPIITFFDFEEQGMSERSIKLSELSTHLPEKIRIFGKDSLMDGIDILEREYREEDPERRHFVIFAGLNRARRLLDDDNAYGIDRKSVV